MQEIQVQAKEKMEKTLSALQYEYALSLIHI